MDKMAEHRGVCSDILYCHSEDKHERGQVTADEAPRELKRGRPSYMYEYSPA